MLQFGHRTVTKEATERSNSPGAGECHSSNNLTNQFEKHAVPRSGAMSCYAALRMNHSIDLWDQTLCALSVLKILVTETL
jgi:hypothetical protein